MGADRQYAFYPGCSLHSTAKEYRESSEVVCRALGVDLVEIEDWNCCGASSAHGTDHVLNVSLAARNLAIAEGMDLDQVAVPCAACYNRLAVADHELRSDPALRAEVDPSLPRPYELGVRVRSLLDVISVDVGEDAIRAAVRKPLEGLKVACYYGCLLVRPPKAVGCDRSEDPQTLDTLVRALGAETVDWPHKTECCGASFSLTRKDIVHKLTGDILHSAKLAGANCIACACPLCMTNLDMRQAEIERIRGEEFHLPILYFTELLGLAMDLPEAKKWFKMHFVSPEAVLRAKPAAQEVSV